MPYGERNCGCDWQQHCVFRRGRGKRAGIVGGSFASLWRQSLYGMEGSDAAVSMWPQEQVAQGYYMVSDVTSLDTKEVLPQTDFVISSEVLPSTCPRVRRISLCGIVAGAPQAPRMVFFFTAATHNQDLGQNLTHVNENSLSYWVITASVSLHRL